MVKLGAMNCDRNRTYIENKCFRGMVEREKDSNQFKDEPIEVESWMVCGDYPEIRPEYAPAEMKKYGVNVIFLASCCLPRYPPFQYKGHKAYIENVLGLPMVAGTHPKPQNYIDAHTKIEDGTGLEDYLQKKTILRKPINTTHPAQTTAKGLNHE